MTDSRGWWTAGLVVATAIVLRSLVYLVYEQSFFDSDQAIVGLMAMHLIDGRAFPLFYYGQIYLLGIDAWVAAAFFVVLGPTVFALHLSVVVVNALAAGLMLLGLRRWGGLSPAEAVLALSFFVFAPPLTAASLIEAGANIWPFVCVPLLWMWRDRPVRFGVTLAIGVLYREFTVYALAAILATDVLARTLWLRHRLRAWAIAGVVAVAVWAGVQALKPYADLAGPGTRGGRLTEDSYTQIGTVLSRLDIAPGDYPERLAAMVGTHLPRLLGVQRNDQAIAAQGHDWLLWIVFPGLALILVAALVNGRRATYSRAAFGWYLAGVGALSALGFVATRPAEEPSERYYLLALLLPVGITAVSLAINRARAWRVVTMAVVGIWLAGSVVDHVGQVRRYVGGRVPDDMRALADALVERDIRVARAGYWRAYKTAFLTREFTRVATTEVVRIDEYQELAEAAGAELVLIREAPCAGGEQVGIFWLCAP